MFVGKCTKRNFSIFTNDIVEHNFSHVFNIFTLSPKITNTTSDIFMLPQISTRLFIFLSFFVLIPPANSSFYSYY